MTLLNAGLYLGDVERSVSYEGLRVSYTRYHNDRSIERMHAHANPHFSLVLAGGNLEKKKTGELERLPGMLTFYYSGEFHQNRYAGPGSAHLNVELEPEFLARHETRESDLAMMTSDPASKFGFLKLYKEVLTPDEASPVNAQSILLDLLQNGQSYSRQKPGWVEKLDQYLRANPDATHSLSLLATEVGVHPITISKHFPKYFSCTLGEHIRKLRTERALQLIRNSTLPLTQIGAECGFADQSHFIRTFKHYTGFRPNEFRKN